MGHKILGFPNALRLASICVKHFTKEEIGKMQLNEFVYSLLDVTSEEDTEFLVSQFQSEKDVNEVVSGMANMIAENWILELIDFYEQAGGK